MCWEELDDSAECSATADLALVVGFLVVSRPFFDLSDSRMLSMSQGQRMQVG